MKRVIVTYILSFFVAANVYAQERVGPLYYRVPTTNQSVQANKPSRSLGKGTAISLPFFEDFTDYDFFPDTSKWIDRKVFINNNMSVNPISRGVATFDGIDENGLPYEKSQKTVLRYCDSLTSQKLDLSIYAPSDSIYLSFFYQPQGNGFEPQPQDSLMLYFRRSNTTSPWTRVWRVAGTAVQPFTQVMIPIAEANFFHADFQFRFVNKASMSNADDHWHVDYIRIDRNRNMNDTAVNDIAYVQSPTPLLGDYTYMPYHQYIANAANERANQHQTAIRNNTDGNVNVNYGYTATNNGNTIGSGNGSVSIGAKSEANISFPTYTSTPPAPVQNERITFEHKYYIQSGGNTGDRVNDTIVHQQHFHNYLAYDDGSAEKSYYLNLFATLPGKIAIEHRLNQPDTLKGVGICFGRQVPLAYQKFFSVVVYKDIDFNGGSEQILYQEDFFTPDYLQQNGFWYYKFEQPVVLQQGKFFIGTIQPALGASDSLYFALDEQRTGSNHVFYNVLNKWEQSTINGAIMIRPLFGQFFPSVVPTQATVKHGNWDVIPNPATDRIRFNYNQSKGDADYTIVDMHGRIIRQGMVEPSGWVDVKTLTAGTYVVYLTVDGQKSQPQTITKL